MASWRLERGRFQVPVVHTKRREVLMEPAPLAMLLDGIDFNVRRLARWKPEARSAADRGDLAPVRKSWRALAAEYEWTRFGTYSAGDA